MNLFCYPLFSQDTILVNIYNNPAYQLNGWNNWKPFNQRDFRIPSGIFVNTKGFSTGISAELNTQEGLRDLGAAYMGNKREVSYSRWERSLKIVGIPTNKKYDLIIYGSGIFSSISSKDSVRFSDIKEPVIINNIGNENYISSFILIERKENSAPVFNVKDTVMAYSGIEDFIPIKVQDPDGDSITLSISEERINSDSSLSVYTEPKPYISIKRYAYVSIFTVTATDTHGLSSLVRFKVKWVLDKERLINIFGITNGKSSSDDVIFGITVEGNVKKTGY